MMKMKINRIVSFFMKYYIVSGGFDPIHEGHIAMINEAACRSDGVILLLNSDEWLCRKKGKNFMNFHTRKTICENLKNVTKVLAFNDDDNSAGDGIRLVREQFQRRRSYPRQHPGNGSLQKLQRFARIRHRRRK